jgi:hypothetical protein
MTTAFLYDTQIEELPQFWTDELVDQFLEDEEDFFEDFYQYEDDQALEEFSLACAYGEDY